MEKRATFDGRLVPLLLLWWSVGLGPWAAVAAAAALVGLLAYEHGFVMAGQGVVIS